MSYSGLPYFDCVPAWLPRLAHVVITLSGGTKLAVKSHNILEQRRKKSYKVHHSPRCWENPGSNPQHTLEGEGGAKRFPIRGGLLRAMPTSTHTEPDLDSGYRVLFVDDDFNQRAVIRILLEDKGYRVETAEDGQEAWLRICAAMRGHAKKYDVVITDLDMPKLDGMELIRMVRKVGFAMRLMVYTGKLTPARRILLNALAVDAAVEKGIESNDLLNLIGNLAMGAGGV